MFPAGYTHFGYLYRKLGSGPKVVTTKIICGRGYLEEALGENLLARGLKLPDGNLVIDGGKSEISILRSLVLSRKGLSVFYNRLYPAQDGFKEVVATVDRMFEKGYTPRLDDVFLSRQFEKYLINNLYFIERAVFVSDASARAEIENSVNFVPHKELQLPEAQIECLICLSEDFIGEMDQAYWKITRRDFSARQRKILAPKKTIES